METVVPAELNTVSDEELVALHDALIAEFDKVHDSGSNDVATLGQIADAVEAIRNETETRQTAAAEAAEAVAALVDRVHKAEEVEVAEEEIAVEAIAEDAEQEVTEEEEEEVTEEVENKELELVTASAPKAPSASAVRRHTVSPEAPKAQGPEVVITAAADVPGYAGGQNIGLLDVARAMHSKARTLNDRSPRVPVAQITYPIAPENKVGADLAHNLDVLDRVTKPSALTASGWCAPSTNLYDLFAIDAGDGLIDLPTVQVTRGGLNVPGFIGFGDAADALWTWTEDSRDDEETKPCLYIPCPEFSDYRLEAEGLCITAGNLTDRAYPELTQRFVQLAINSHLHRLSAAIIAKITGGATGVSMNAVNSSAAGSILNAIDLQVADYRSQYRMSVNSVLEAVFPLWTRELMRADLAMRNGVALTNVSDDDLAAHFSVRKVRPQFVHDYQPLYGMGAAVEWPASVSFLLYAAGSYVRGDGGTIDLGVVRDSVLNATNDYTAAWTEQLYLVAKVGPAAREVEVTLSVDGTTACCPTEPVS